MNLSPFNLLLNNVSSYLKKKGFFIFTQRVDLWKEFNFDKILKINSEFTKSRALLNVLPKPISPVEI